METSSLSLVDAHCHIDLLKDGVQAVARAEATGTHTIAVTNAPSVFFHTRDLCRGKTFAHAALGLHPELVATHAHEIEKFKVHIAETRFVGEVGLDYVTTDQQLRKRQRDVLTAIVQCCSDAGGRILSVHSRRAASDVIDIMGEGPNNSVILHWFSGTKRELERGLQLGAYFSVNTAMLTSQSGSTIVRAIPPERMLTETDAPFAKVAGRPATPEMISLAAKSLAAIWFMGEKEAGDLVLSNFRSLLDRHPARALDRP